MKSNIAKKKIMIYLSQFENLITSAQIVLLKYDSKLKKF